MLELRTSQCGSTIDKVDKGWQGSASWTEMKGRVLASNIIHSKESSDADKSRSRNIPLQYVGSPILQGSPLVKARPPQPRVCHQPVPSRLARKPRLRVLLPRFFAPRPNLR